MTTTTLFALREKESGELLTFSVSSNDGADNCGDTEVKLDTGDDNVWYAKTAVQAEYVRQYPTEWYNAGMDTPNHSYEADELEVVQVVRTEEITLADVKIPTVSEWIELKYRKAAPKQADYLHTQSINKYSLYDLKEVLK